MAAKLIRLGVAIAATRGAFGPGTPALAGRLTPPPSSRPNKGHPPVTNRDQGEEPPKQNTRRLEIRDRSATVLASRPRHYPSTKALAQAESVDWFFYPQYSIGTRSPIAPYAAPLGRQHSSDASSRPWCAVFYPRLKVGAHAPLKKSNRPPEFRRPRQRRTRLPGPPYVQGASTPTAALLPRPKPAGQASVALRD